MTVVNTSTDVSRKTIAIEIWKCIEFCGKLKYQMNRRFNR